MISYPENSAVRAVARQPVPGSWFRVIIVLCLFTLGIVKSPAADAVKAAPIPPFSAKFTMRSEIPAADPATPPEIIMRSEGYFAYSNGVWEVEALARNPKSPDVIILNSRKITGGTRTLWLTSASKTDPNILAAAKATTLVHPEYFDTELFVPWLALCPRPELPIQSGQIIKQFYSPIGEATYHLDFLGAEQAFVSHLIITNKGEIIDPTSKVSKLEAPFDQGFIQFVYEVESMTNFHGLTFPSRSVMYQQGPMQGAGAKIVGIRAHHKTYLMVESLAPGFRNFDVPPIMAANDYRSPAVKPGKTMTYRVTDDTWEAPDSPFISEQARLLANH